MNFVSYGQTQESSMPTSPRVIWRMVLRITVFHVRNIFIDYDCNIRVLTLSLDVNHGHHPSGVRLPAPDGCRGLLKFLTAAKLTKNAQYVEELH